MSTAPGASLRRSVWGGGEVTGEVTGQGRDSACPTERGGAERIPDARPIACSSVLRIRRAVGTGRAVSPPDVALPKLPKSGEGDWGEGTSTVFSIHLSLEE